MMTEIRLQLLQSRKFTENEAKRFFKTKPGQYGAHDQFLGVAVPRLRQIAKHYHALPISDIQKLISSNFNEERLLALLILVDRFRKYEDEKEMIYYFYLKNIRYVNNWNLVDASAHHIVGAYLFSKNKSFLIDLAKSKNMWKRRIAIVSTWYFIMHNHFSQTIKIAKILLNDQHDLIHKAVGWMLREMGKRDQNGLIIFLEKHAKIMPRAMLRYAIEKFSQHKKEYFLNIKSLR